MHAVKKARMQQAERKLSNGCLFSSYCVLGRKKKSRTTLRRLVVFITSSLLALAREKYRAKTGWSSILRCNPFSFFWGAKTLIYIEKIGEYKPTIRTSIRSSSSFDRWLKQIENRTQGPLKGKRKQPANTFAEQDPLKVIRRSQVAARSVMLCKIIIHSNTIIGGTNSIESLFHVHICGAGERAKAQF